VHCKRGEGGNRLPCQCSGLEAQAAFALHPCCPHVPVLVPFPVVLFFFLECPYLKAGMFLTAPESLLTGRTCQLWWTR